jgi:hypothetical protein
MNAECGDEIKASKEEAASFKALQEGSCDNI